MAHPISHLGPKTRETKSIVSIIHLGVAKDRLATSTDPLKPLRLLIGMSDPRGRHSVQLFGMGRYKNTTIWRVPEIRLLAHVSEVIRKPLQLQARSCRIRECVELVVSEARCQPPPPIVHIN
jgi:hypothetical protein